MIDTAIILVGGLGSRLKSVVRDVPKPMADINGKPFLFYLIHYLKNQGIKLIILSVGYKSEIIINYFGYEIAGVKLIYSIEETPLGTGGAILRALKLVKKDVVYVFNGDTLFTINLQLMASTHYKKNAKITFALKEMKNVDRYGKVIIDDNDKIIGFQEKGYFKNGMINGGIYIITKKYLQNYLLPNKFSFEQFIESKIEELTIFSYCSNSYFIDIGIPQDYSKARKYVAQMTFN